MSAAPQASPEVSIVVPTLREAVNVPILAQRLHAAMAGRSYELIFVDDNSDDGIEEACAALAASSMPVKLITRRTPDDGLSGAVLGGLAEARGDFLVVMDADLQHPPERIPALLEPLQRQEAEFVLGSRHIAGGGIAESWSAFRRLNSRVAALLARPFAGRVRDPMSGFFAVPRQVLDRARFVAPTGYKIALELMCKTRASPIREVPIFFAARERGQSKLTFREQVRYLQHLSRLYDFSFPRAVPSLKFLVTVAIAFLVTLTVYKVVGASWWSVILGYAGGACVTALLHARYVKAERAFLVRPHPWRDFAFCTITELIAVSLAARYLAVRVHPLSNAELLCIPFAVGTVARYLLRKELILDVRGLRYMPSYTERLAGAVSVDAPPRRK